jgi:hypothetical protein
MRSTIFALAFLFFSASVIAAETITTDTFRLEMKGDWRKLANSDPEQFTLRSKFKRVGLTISTTTFKESGVDLERMTKKLQEFRLDAEAAAAKKFNRKMEIAEPLITKVDRGWHLQYFGQDNTGRRFRFYGIVVPGKLMNIYAESTTADLKQLEEVLQEIFAGLQF